MEPVPKLISMPAWGFFRYVAALFELARVGADLSCFLHEMVYEKEKLLFAYVPAFIFIVRAFVRSFAFCVAI